MSYIIYQITNKINDKIYIGQTTKTFSARKSHYKWSVNSYLEGTYRGSTVIIPAIAKYGIDNFEFNIIAECKTINDLNQTEIECIKQYNSLCPKGYNIELGGKNSPISEETKKKMSEAQLGTKNHMFGKTHSNKAREAISKANKGYCPTEEVRRKISEANKGKTHSKETKSKLSEINKGKTKISSDIQDIIRNEYAIGKTTYQELATQYNVHKRTISCIINNYSKSNNPVKKINETQVIEIKKLIAEGKLLRREIGKLFGVSRGAIDNIAHNRTWKYIT
jgi:group I intron endonuclease